MFNIDSEHVFHYDFDISKIKDAFITHDTTDYYQSRLLSLSNKEMELIMELRFNRENECEILENIKKLSFIFDEEIKIMKSFRDRYEIQSNSILSIIFSNLVTLFYYLPIKKYINGNIDLFHLCIECGEYKITTRLKELDEDQSIDVEIDNIKVTYSNSAHIGIFENLMDTIIRIVFDDIDE